MHKATPTILIVEDDKDDCFFLADSFTKSGSTADLLFAGDGEEAINLLTTISPSSLPALIVLDLNMPKKDGLQTLNYIKNIPELAVIPVIVFSTSDNKFEKEMCLQLGAASFLKKPDNFIEYKKIVQKFTSIVAGYTST